MYSALDVKCVDVRKLLTDMGCLASLDLSAIQQQQVDIDERRELREAYLLQLARDDEVRRAQRTTVLSSSPTSPPTLSSQTPPPPPLLSSLPPPSSPLPQQSSPASTTVPPSSLPRPPGSLSSTIDTVSMNDTVIMNNTLHAEHYNNENLYENGRCQDLVLLCRHLEGTLAMSTVSVCRRMVVC